MNRNIRLLEIYNACLSALFIIPVLVPFYRDVIGLSFEDFLIGEAVFAGVVVAMEVPSGWVSDIWKRKNTLIASCLFWIGGFSLLLAADTLAETIFSQAVIGIAVSLFSGTSSAILYDTLAAEERTGEYSRLEGRRFGIGHYSVAMASVASGFLYMAHPMLPLAATIAAAIPATICCMLLIEPPRCKKPVQGHPIKDMAATVKYALHGHADIGFIIIFAGLLFGATKLIMWVQQPYYMALELPEYTFGLLMAVGFALSGISSHLAHRLDGRVSNLRAMAAALCLALLICLLSGLEIGMHGVILLMFGGSCLYGLTMPRVNDAINRRISGERRATILSTTNLLRELCFIPLSLIAAYAIAQGDIGSGLFVIAGWLVIAGLVIAAWANRRARRVSPLVQS